MSSVAAAAGFSDVSGDAATQNRGAFFCSPGAAPPSSSHRAWGAVLASWTEASWKWRGFSLQTQPRLPSALIAE
jgi:hypothetical protein